jgi:hypothetical protein
MATKAETNSPSATSIASVRGITRNLNRGLRRDSPSGPKEGGECDGGGRAAHAVTVSPLG